MDFDTVLNMMKEYTLFYLSTEDTEDMATFKAAQLAKDTITEALELIGGFEDE